MFSVLLETACQAYLHFISATKLLLSLGVLEPSSLKTLYNLFMAIKRILNISMGYDKAGRKGDSRYDEISIPTVSILSGCKVEPSHTPCLNEIPEINF